MKMVHRTVTIKRYKKHKIQTHIPFFSHCSMCALVIINLQNSPTNVHFLYLQLFFIKNNENSFMFRLLRDHHQGICTSTAYSFSDILTQVNISCLLGTDKFYIVHSMHWQLLTAIDVQTP